MRTSLIRMRAAIRRRAFLSRLLASVLAVVFAFVATPCCEVYAAPTIASHHAAGDGEVPDHAPHDDSLCGNWLDTVGIPSESFHQAVPADTGVRADMPATLFSAGILLSSVEAVSNTSGRRTHSPPAGLPAYLRFAHLLM